MEEGSNPPPSFGSGQQRPQHPRPFFYVQPPSQPYYFYQHWQLNNPYAPYGLPGGFNIGRPCVHPYQLMQYPGFVFPHAPLYPMDYRRMFEPRFHSPTWNENPRQQHHSQAQGRPEMACSEAQTDPSDAITKLIQCLNKIRVGELQGMERELDSGVASQSSEMISPEEKKSEEQSVAHILPSLSEDSHLESSAVTFSGSTTAVYDGESSQRSLEALSSHECWSGGFDEVLPLDSSSVHEECPGIEQAGYEQFLPCCSPEKADAMDIQPDISVIESSVAKCSTELRKQRLDPFLSTQSLVPSLPCSQTDKDDKTGVQSLRTEHQEASWDEVSTDPCYQILKLPFECILTAGASQAGGLSSPTAPYCYSCLPMQTTHERLSVLSPSLDELSSRDEMFSTDLEDMDFFPKHVYAGRRLAEDAGRSPQPTEEVEVWPVGSKRFMCACCGKNLSKGPSRIKVHNTKVYRNEDADSEEEGRYGQSSELPIRVVVRKHSAPRRLHALPQRHAPKPSYKKGQYKELSDPVDQEEVHSLYKQDQDPGDGEIVEITGNELQCRTCHDRFCREDMTTSDQSRWGEGDVISRRRQSTLLQRRERSAQRKVMYHRIRDEGIEDDELPTLHWDRGSTVRGEPRC
ncbi:bucky ball [Thalassophryne amazonica]|uniref:bucky ball n=1 Tax=Thalassophryne amazonica TaxID=390379 RepID=UPI00147171B4|nr:bucky ball [Thalassophryne amazonica]